MVKTRKYPSKYTCFPETLLENLKEASPAFANKTRDMQVAVAAMIWAGTSARRAHFMHEGFVSFHHTELARAFNGQFKSVNNRLEFLDVKENWRFTSSTMAEGFTKAYRLSEKYQIYLNQYLANRSTDLTKILDGRGHSYKNVPNAVSSLDMANVGTKKRWDIINAGTSLSVVKIDTSALQELIPVLNKVICDWVHIEHPSQDPTIIDPNFLEAQNLKATAQKFMVMANTQVTGDGCIMQRYIESPSGRLYGLGVSLQNSPRILRKTALNGLIDYDINNCHFSLIQQMAQQNGVRCVHIGDYLKRKNQIRDEISHEIGINIEDSKKCLIALIYGAKTTTWHKKTQFLSLLDRRQLQSCTGYLCLQISLKMLQRQPKPLLTVPNVTDRGAL